MECNEYLDLLIQYPFNELEEVEAALLNDHLKSCEKCLAELKKYEQLFEFTGKISAMVPEDKEKQENINSILNKIKSPGKLQSRQPINYRIIRIVINTAAIFLIGLFLFQQMEIKRNLQNLNTRIENQYQNNLQNDIPVSIKEITRLDDRQIERLLLDYNRILKENKAILEYLKRNYPDIYMKLKEMKNIHEL